MGRAFEQVFGPETGGNLINLIFKSSNTRGEGVEVPGGDV